MGKILFSFSYLRPIVKDFFRSPAAAGNAKHLINGVPSTHSEDLQSLLRKHLSSHQMEDVLADPMDTPAIPYFFRIRNDLRETLIN